MGLRHIIREEETQPAGETDDVDGFGVEAISNQHLTVPFKRTCPVNFRPSLRDAVDRMSDDEDKLIIGKRCYVGNLAWRTSWQDLKDKFRECGTVVYANVMRTEDGRSRGWGIVEFESPEEAYKAVQELNGVELNGRPLMVREDREDRDVKNYQLDHARETRTETNDEQKCQIVVHGIPFKYTWRELKDFFNQKVGGAAHANIVMGRDGRSRGWGTVRFETPEGARRAIEAVNDSLLDGRRLGVKLDEYA